LVPLSASAEVSLSSIGSKRPYGTAPYVFEGSEGARWGTGGALIGRDAGGVDVLNDMKEM